MKHWSFGVFASTCIMAFVFICMPLSQTDARIIEGFGGGIPISSQMSSFSSIVKTVTPAVVNIQVTQGDGVKAPRDPRRRDHDGPPGKVPPSPFGGPPPGLEPKPPPGHGEEPAGPGRPDMSGGSGVIVDPNGYIVTNNHVIDRASDIKVYLSNKKEYPAKVIGADPKTDLAVIKIEATDLPHLKWGNYNELSVGDIVLAVGSPFGLSQTVTMGIISALGRANVGIADYEDFIQTDASINPGNSGGALVNLKGELIGINTAIFSRTGGNEGIGFAIPVSFAQPISESLKTKGKVVRGWLGVAIQEITPDLAKAFKIKETKGALVSDVNESGPAFKAGVLRGDVVVEFDGKEVTSVSQLRNRVAETKFDGKTKTPLKVIRDGKEKNLTILLAERPPDEVLAQAGALFLPEKKTEEKLPENVLKDVKVKALDEETRAQLNLGPKFTGVVVTHVTAGSPAENAGLQRGDLIQEINRQKVTGVKDYEAVRAKMKKEEDAVLLLMRQGNTLFAVINP